VSPSSTFDSKPTLKKTTIGLVVGLLLIALIDPVAGLIISRVSQAPPEISDGRTSQGVMRLWQDVEAGITPVVFTGSSQVMAGLSPRVFMDQVQAMAGKHVEAVNVSVIGGKTTITRDLIRYLLIPNGVHVLIYGVSMREMKPPPATEHLGEAFWDAPLGYALSQPTSFQRSLTLWLLEHSALIRYRNNIRDWLTGKFFQNDPLSRSDNYGYWVIDGVHNRDVQGFKDQFTPFETNSTYLDPLRDIFGMCQQQVQCLILNMPLHPDGNKLLTAQDTQRYWDALHSVANGKITIWNFDTPDCQADLGDNSFLDLYHLNTTGAPKFTQAIAALYLQQIEGQNIESPAGLSCAKVVKP
jgi:hypothetical protein